MFHVEHFLDPQIAEKRVIFVWETSPRTSGPKNPFQKMFHVEHFDRFRQFPASALLPPSPKKGFPHRQIGRRGSWPQLSPTGCSGERKCSTWNIFSSLPS